MNFTSNRNKPNRNNNNKQTIDNKKNIYAIIIVRSLYLTTFQAIVAIGVVYEIAPPTWEDLTHLALSGLVYSSNEVWREGTDLVSVARELGLYWGHTLRQELKATHRVGLYDEHALVAWMSVFVKTRCRR